MKKRLAFPIVISMLISLVACNLPASTPGTETPISFTAIAQTIEARLTNVAQTQAVDATMTPTLAPATNTPPPPTASFTPLPQQPQASSTQSCDLAEFVSDVTVPDGENHNAGDVFTKTWRLKNVGTCTWTTSYALIFAGDTSNQMGGASSVPLAGNVAPGQTVDVSVQLTAPTASGTYTGNWKVRNAAGLAFTFIYVKITVGGGGTGDGTATVTPAGGGDFAVTHVDYTTSGGCSGFDVIAKIQTNGAGTVTYHWVRSDGATDTVLHPALSYSEAGSQSVNTDWNASATGDYWIALYVDEPNHQQIGQAAFSCP